MRPPGSRQVVNISGRTFVMRMRFMSLLHRFSCCRHGTREELDHGVAEYIVAVPGDHVSGTGNVDVFTVRAQFQERLRAGLAQDVGQTAAHEQGR